MCSRIRREINKRTIGGVIVLIGFLGLIGTAGTSDLSLVSIIPLMLKGIGCLVVMAIGGKMIGGEEDEDSL